MSNPFDGVRIKKACSLVAILTATVVPHTGQCADQATVKQSMSIAADYLRANFDKFSGGGRKILAGYALYKAGDPITSKELVAVLQEIDEKMVEGNYVPKGGDAAIYEAGIVAMLLSDIDPVKYQPQLQAIVNFIVESQQENGSWDYRHGNGDTSVTQYGCLGLWAASRAGIEVPGEVWDKSLRWHFTAQLADGGFPYSPGSALGQGKGASTFNMTGAAVASMTIAGMHLFPDKNKQLMTVSAPKKAQTDPDRKFGLLEQVAPQPEVTVAEEQPVEPLVVTKPQEPYRAQTSFPEVQQHVNRALSWANGNFNVEYPFYSRMYYYYTLERMCALTGLEEVGGQDWYEMCSDYLVERQSADGSWRLDVHDTGGQYPVGTSFGILFLSRSTAKLLNRLPPRRAVGGGLLAGGRGLPDDLKHVDLNQGDVVARVPTGPLDELLRDLSRAGGDDLFKVQQQIIEKIQLGDRSELVGQTDQLVKLLDHPDPQIRRTAMWALGRSDDLKLVRYAIEAVIDDPDTDVLVEAHAALCWFSRRPDGFGLADNPVAVLSPDVTEEDRQAAIDKWRRQAVKVWGQWYLRICPYDERDDPFLIRLKRRVDSRG